MVNTMVKLSQGSSVVMEMASVIEYNHEVTTTLYFLVHEWIYAPFSLVKTHSASLSDHALCILRHDTKNILIMD